MVSRLRRVAGTCLVSVAVVATSTVLGAQEPAPTDSSESPDQKSSRRVTVLPVLGSAPETGFQYGISLFATQQHDVAGTRPSSIISNAVRTTKGQSRAFVDVDRWTANNDWRFAGSAIWQRFPLPFFGVGENTEEDARELYTPRGTDIWGIVQRRVGGVRWVQGIIRRTENEMLKTEPGGLLEPDTLTGSRGGRVVLATVALISDSRDNLFAPSSGHYAEFGVTRADGAIGSEFGFTRVRAETRNYFAIPGMASGNLLAIQTQIVGVTEGAPFDQLAQVGSGSLMRGYFPGRFRDQWMTAAQAEYRSATWNGWGVAVFGGAGAVAGTAGELLGARILPSVGGGLRLRMDPRTGATIRVDYARGTPGQSGLYVSFNEAF
jgi:hypothetical protein